MKIDDFKHCEARDRVFIAAALQVLDAGGKLTDNAICEAAGIPHGSCRKERLSDEGWAAIQQIKAVYKALKNAPKLEQIENKSAKLSENLRDLKENKAMLEQEVLSLQYEITHLLQANEQVNALQDQIKKLTAENKNLKRENVNLQARLVDNRGQGQIIPLPAKPNL